MRWHLTWSIWAGLTLLLEALGLRTGGPLTRTARAYLLGGAAGSALVGAVLTWWLYHWAIDVEGLDLMDLAAAALGAGIGVAGWAHRTGRTDMLEKLRFLRSWLWEELRDLVVTFWTERGRALLDRALQEVRAVDARTDLTGAQKRELVTERLRAFASGIWPGIRTQVIHDAIQIALRRLRGAEGEEGEARAPERNSGLFGG